MNTPNYILTIDNFLNERECDELINYYYSNKNKTVVKKCGYTACDVELSDLFNKKINKIPSLYINKFPEADITEDKWYLRELRIKYFKPGDSFNNWHSEHKINSPLRMLALQIYLSTHKCGTKFYNHKTIQSKKGRLAVWPAYFTHTHKGEVCPDNLDRFVFSGYYTLTNEFI